MRLDAEAYAGQIREDIDSNSALLRVDAVNQFVQSLKDSTQIGKPFSIAEMLAVYVEGEKRYEYMIPPGYMDADKDKTDDSKTKKFGDLVVWKQLLMKAKTDDKDVLFVTSDNKEDWWVCDKDEPVAPRDELVQEFRSYCGPQHRLVMLLLPEFHKHIANSNIVSHQAKIELNLDGIVRKLVELRDRYDLIDQDLGSHLIHSGELQDYVSDGLLGDVEIEYISRPDLTNLNVDFDEDKAFVEGEFAVRVTASVEIQYSSEYSVYSNVHITVSGTVEIQLTVEYNDRENLVDYENSTVDFGHYEVIAAEIESPFDDEPDDLCILCEKRYGIYSYDDGESEGMVCGTCVSDCDVCIECGKAFPSDSLSGAMCAKCNSLEVM